jgi:hypothetical protein
MRAKRATKKAAGPELETLDQVAAEIRAVYLQLEAATTHVRCKVLSEKLKALRLLAAQLRERDFDNRTRDLEEQIASINTQLAGRQGQALRANTGAVIPRVKRRGGEEN